MAQPAQRSGTPGQEPALVTPSKGAMEKERHCVCFGCMTIKVTALLELLCCENHVVKSHFRLFLLDFIPKQKEKKIANSLRGKYYVLTRVVFISNWTTTVKQLLCLTWKLIAE